MNKQIDKMGRAAGMLFIQVMYTAVMSLITLMAVAVVFPTLVTVSGLSWVGMMWLLMFFLGESDEER
jgi:hypothetical protein